VTRLVLVVRREDPAVWSWRVMRRNRWIRWTVAGGLLPTWDQALRHGLVVLRAHCPDQRDYGLASR